MLIMNTKTISFGLIIVGLLFSSSVISEALRIYNVSECQLVTGDNTIYVCPSINSQFSGIKSSWVGVSDNASTEDYCARMNAISFFGESVQIRSGAEKCTGLANKSSRATFLNTGGLSDVPRDASYYHLVTIKSTATAKTGGGLTLSAGSGVRTYFVTEN
jgi:hypothetical protein